MSVRTLSQLVERSRCLLLDFDGPVCSVFARYPAPVIAAELKSLLLRHGAPVGRITDERDPFEVLRYTATLDQPGLTRQVEDALHTAELAAVRSATPTPYAREVIIAACRSGRHVAIVSNNSEDAIHAYLEIHHLTHHINAVVGRTYANPTSMKPNPEPITRAAHELRVQPSNCLLVGDSRTDIEGAHTAGSLAIGYANKPHKYPHLTNAEAVINAMADLAAAFRGLAKNREER